MNEILVPIGMLSTILTVIVTVGGMELEESILLLTESAELASGE